MSEVKRTRISIQDELRALVAPVGITSLAREDLFECAADRIDELQAQCMLNHDTTKAIEAERDAALAEIERLRAALYSIMTCIARAALRGEEGK